MTDQVLAQDASGSSAARFVNPRDPYLADSAGRFGSRRLPATRILDVPVSLMDMDFAVQQILAWARDREGGMVCVRDVHGVMCHEEIPALRDVHERASMITPDGMPLALTSRWRGHKTGRVSGPSLVEEVCKASAGMGIRHYLYGGKEGVPEQMAANLRQRYPGVEIVGTLSPPFGAIAPEEDARISAQIEASQPHIIWVGLSTPKQDFWMDEHRARFPGVVLIGVGAAFDFHAGAVKRAPVWMQKACLEWLHRLGSEPRRLWRRYLVLAPKFLWRMLSEAKPRH